MLKYIKIRLVILFYLFTNCFIFGQDYTYLHPDIKYTQDSNSLFKIYIKIPNKKSSTLDWLLNYQSAENNILEFELNSDSCLLVIIDSTGFKNFPVIYNSMIANLKGKDYYYELHYQGKKSLNYNQELYNSLINTYEIDSICDYDLKNYRITNNSLVLEIFHQTTNYNKRVFRWKNVILNYDNDNYIIDFEDKGLIKPFEWKIKKKKEEFQISTINEKYKIVISPSKLACDCCDEFALRIFENDKYLWQNEFRIICKTDIIIHDFQNDGNDEIILYNNNHGIISIIILEKE